MSAFPRGLAGLLALAFLAPPARTEPAGHGPKLEPVVGHATAFGVSRPVRELPPRPKPDRNLLKDAREIRNPSLPHGGLELPIKRRVRMSESGDAAVYGPARAPAAMPAPLVSFDALGNADNEALVGGYVAPPDTNGDIGPHHYVQTVNIAVRVYDRAGVPLTPPFLMSELFAAIGGPCSVFDDGDPVVVYDHLADRWLISQFAFPSFPFGPFYQCIAVSETGDPTGAYFAYSFEMPGDKLNDYPKFGVWPDAFYMTDNQFRAVSLDFAGGGVFAFDRVKMLAGDPQASVIYFDLDRLDPLIGGMLPSDLDGPPVSRPNVMAFFTATEFGNPQGDGLRMFEFHPDFATPAQSTFTELPFVPVAAFDPVTPAAGGAVPQPGAGSRRLDAIGDRLMYRLQYRRFASHESLVVSHTVDASGDPSPSVYRAGVRYYELRRLLSSGGWGVYEQATYAPADGVHRWMPSAALDNDGNLALGFSVSNGTDVFPGIRYAGRLATDPPGGLFQGEATLQAGGSVQTFFDRWGDYSMLAVDPTDDCTFWFTSEYYADDPGCEPGYQGLCWQTRVASFRFPSCTPPLPNGTLAGRVVDAATSAPVAGALVKATGEYVAFTDAAGAFSLSVTPGTYALTASRAGYLDAQAIGETVASGGTTTVDLALGPTPLLAFESRLVDDSQGNANGNVDRDECVGLAITLRNGGTAAATDLRAALATSTPGVVVTTGIAAYPDLAPGASGSNLTAFRIQTSPSFQPGTVIALEVRVATAQGPLTVAVGLKTGTVNPTPFVFNAPGPVPIPDGGTADLAVVVSGLTAPVARVRLAARITHTGDGDLRLSLIGPDQTTVVLADRRGGFRDNFGTDCPTDDGDDTIFDDDAAMPIAEGTPPFVGSFRPEQPLGAFDGKVGTAANGVWTFRVEDLQGGRVGTIECVTVFINDYSLVTGGGGCGPHLSIGEARVDPEAEAKASFAVTLSPALSSAATVQYATADSTATAGADYTPTSGTLVFAPGETAKTVEVPILADSLDEFDESFYLSLSNATGATIGGRGVGTIVDDDPAPDIRISDASVVEGQAGLAALVFDLALSAPSGKPVVAHFETADGTATSPADYQSAAANLTLAPGRTSIPVRVNVVGDRVAEPDESLSARLTAAVNAVVVDAVGVGTILDDDVSAFYAVPPCRLLDTRPTLAPLSANTTRELVLAGGPCGVPANAGAVAVNVTAVAPTDPGDLRFYPAGQPEPLASLINFAPGRTRANSAIVLMGAEGRVWVKCDMPAGSSGTVHLVLDVYGYFQ